MLSVRRSYGCALRISLGLQVVVENVNLPNNGIDRPVRTTLSLAKDRRK